MDVPQFADLDSKQTVFAINCIRLIRRHESVYCANPLRQSCYG